MLSETGSPSFVSYANHMAHMRAALFGRLNAEAMAQGIDPVMEFRGDIHEFFDRWIADAPPMRHVAAWWDLRGEPNVLFVHYNDLKADLDREMRRVAAFLNIGIPAARWPVVVDGCTFESMRADADKVGNFDRAFEGAPNRSSSRASTGAGGRCSPKANCGATAIAWRSCWRPRPPAGSNTARSWPARVHESVSLTVAPAGACRSFWRPRRTSALRARPFSSRCPW